MKKFCFQTFFIFKIQLQPKSQQQEHLGQLGTLFVVQPAVVAADWGTSPIAGRVKQILEKCRNFLKP